MSAPNQARKEKEMNEAGVRSVMAELDALRRDPEGAWGVFAPFSREFIRKEMNGLYSQLAEALGQDL